VTSKELSKAFTILDSIDDTRRTEAFHLINAALLNLKFALDKFTVDERNAIAAVMKIVGEKTITKLLKNETYGSLGFGDDDFNPADYAKKMVEPSKFASELFKSVGKMFENATPPDRSDSSQ
jgi:hypothetical protein